MNQFERALSLQLDLESWTPVFQKKVYSLFVTTDAHIGLGQLEEARKIVERIRQGTNNAVENARCAAYEGLCLRIEGKYREASDLLQTIPSKFPAAQGMWKFALLTASSILASIGECDESLLLFDRADRMDPKGWFTGPGQRSIYLGPPLIAKSNLREAAKAYMEDGQFQDTSVAIHAHQMLLAAILFELSDDRKAAQTAWIELTRRFPPHYCNYLPDIAEHLLSERPMDLNLLLQTPYPLRVRTELFFLTGLLMLKRDDKGSGRRLFEQCIMEDRTNHWPTVLAQKAIAQSQ